MQVGWNWGDFHYQREENKKGALPENDGDIGDQEGSSTSCNGNYQHFMDNKGNTNQRLIPSPPTDRFTCTPNINHHSSFSQESNFTIGSGYHKNSFMHNITNNMHSMMGPWMIMIQNSQ
ncbi:hypothetical protein O181_098297 [Austropuccinia psidii MF-1]|uniref:Uncharacterized protein n=1 Tax=Austropuccinia psidii MF-1 TaxID=1389203 RepID=A0A9Q3JA47_9BASI|nr:hypothetical protein [Austropuccinia psidii MF-1]